MLILNIVKKNQITVKGIKDYGDEGLVEFIISELIRLIKGLGEKTMEKISIRTKRKKNWNHRNGNNREIIRI